MEECRAEVISEDRTRTSSNINLSENRLHEYIVRFNQTLSENTDLKQSIEVIRRERDMFESIRRKMSREIERKGAEISAMVDKSNADYAARDLANSQIAHLKSQADREHLEFEKEWAELARLIENDKKMREFVQLKDAKDRQHAKRISIASPSPQVPVDETGQLRSKLSTVQSQFDSIKLATGTTSIDQLLHFFVEKEKINFSLFNRASEHLLAMDKLQSSVKHVEEEISTFRSSVDSIESAKPSNRAEIERRCDDLATKYSVLHKLLATARVTIQSIFFKLFGATKDYDRYLNPLVVAASTSVPIGSVTDANVIDYLAAVEGRVDELIAVYLTVFPPTKRAPSLAKSGARKSIFASQQKAAHALQSGPIVLTKMSQYRLPSAIGDEDDHEHDRDGEVLRLLSRNELRSRTLDSIQRAQDRHKRTTPLK